MTKQNLSHPFTVGQIDNGRWLAVSSRAPYFCFEGESLEEVRQTAHRALNFYFGKDGEVVSRSVKSREKKLSTFRKVGKHEHECVAA
jgi:predicted RNase H-like HicB family nuclease